MDKALLVLPVPDSTLKLGSIVSTKLEKDQLWARDDVRMGSDFDFAKR